MEVDIAPQFGAELKVKSHSLPINLEASTDMDKLIGWLQNRKRLGMLRPYILHLPGACALPPVLVHAISQCCNANIRGRRSPVVLLGSMTYSSSTVNEAL